jgi:hypothetical protein
MPYTPEQQKEIQLKMFGCDIDKFVESVESSIAFRVSGPAMVIMSMLSDVQELIYHGKTGGHEEARQTLNKAKYLVDKYLSKDKGE